MVTCDLTLSLYGVSAILLMVGLDLHTVGLLTTDDAAALNEACPWDHSVHILRARQLLFVKSITFMWIRIKVATWWLLVAYATSGPDQEL